MSESRPHFTFSSGSANLNSRWIVPERWGEDQGRWSDSSANRRAYLECGLCESPLPGGVLCKECKEVLLFLKDTVFRERIKKSLEEMGDE